MATKIQQGLFVELHWFLSKPMEVFKAWEDSACMCYYNWPAAQQRTTCSVRDIFTWIICYNRYVAAVATLRSNRVPSMLVHVNTIVQVTQMFEGLQAAATPNQDWGALNFPLYARTFMATKRRRNVCQFCWSHEHAIAQCPWGWTHPCLVTYPVPRRQSTGPGHLTAPPQLCRSWNTGSC